MAKEDVFWVLAVVFLVKLKWQLFNIAIIMAYAHTKKGLKEEYKILENTKYQNE